MYMYTFTVLIVFMCFVYYHLQVFIEFGGRYGSPHMSCAALKMVCTVITMIPCVQCYCVLHVLYMYTTVLFEYMLYTLCNIVHVCTCGYLCYHCLQVDWKTKVISTVIPIVDTPLGQ